MAEGEPDNPFRAPQADSYRRRAGDETPATPPHGILNWRIGTWLLWGVLILALFAVMFTSRKRRPANRRGPAEARETQESAAPNR